MEWWATSRPAAPVGSSRCAAAGQILATQDKAFTPTFAGSAAEVALLGAALQRQPALGSFTIDPTVGGAS
jgi:hypothetical protein